MTELLIEDATIESLDSETVIYKGYLSSIDEVIEHVKAADTLGLGFRVESYALNGAEEDGDGQHEFEFTLLGELPVRQETGE